MSSFRNDYMETEGELHRHRLQDIVREIYPNTGSRKRTKRVRIIAAKQEGR